MAGPAAASDPILERGDILSDHRDDGKQFFTKYVTFFTVGRDVVLLVAVFPDGEVVFQVFVGDAFFADDLALHGDSSAVHAVGITGNQGVPACQAPALGQAAVGAGGGHPFDGADIVGGELDAGGDAFCTIYVICTAAQILIEEMTDDVRRFDVAGVFVFQLDEAAAGAAVAQAFPLRDAHFGERLGFPEGPGLALRCRIA